MSLSYIIIHVKQHLTYESLQMNKSENNYIIGCDQFNMNSFSLSTIVNSFLTPWVFPVLPPDLRLHDIVIEALELSQASTCAVVGTAVGKNETRKIPCRPGTVGSIVRIRHNATINAILTLCEVEVHGTHGT